MKITTHNPKPAIDFMDFMDELDVKYGWNYRDMAGEYSKEGVEEVRAHKLKWMEENGYGDLWYVLDSPEGSIEDWPRDSQEIKLRVEINTAYMKAENKLLKRPYQNFWHYLLDNDFIEFRRGGVNSIYLGEDRDAPDWAKKVIDAIREEVKDHPAFDGEDVHFYVDW